MGLFGESNDKKEEVTLGLSEDEEKSEDDGNNPEVGAINFDEKESSESDSSSNLKNEISSMDSVTEPSQTGSSTTSGSSKDSPDLEEIRDQNQEIIDKLERVLTRL